MSQLIEQEYLDKSKVVLMTQDEGRFGRVNIPRSCWVPKQVRPLVAKQVVRESFYVYAGICPKLGRISLFISL